MPQVDVSIIIPTRNRREFVCTAIESCIAAAADELVIEIVVVDDGSSDGTPELIGTKYPQVRCLRNEESRGRGQSRNRGLEVASGSFVKFLDDDDWLEAGALASEVRLAREMGSEIVAGGHRSALESGEVLDFAPPDFSRGIDSLLAGEAVPTAAALYRRELLVDLRWPANAVKLDDWYFFVQAGLRAERISSLRKPVYVWRAHPGQGVKRSSLLENAREFYWVLDGLEEAIRASGSATPDRLRRLAQYRYKELRVLCCYDRPGFEAEVSRILCLDAAFQPRDEERQSWMRILAKAVGFRNAVLFHTWVKGWVKGVTR